MGLEDLHPRALRTVCMVYLAARRVGVRLEKLIVYGSWVRGDWLYTSDLDLILVSDDWRGVRLIDRPDPIYRVLASMKPPLWPQLTCYTRKELEEMARGPTSIRDAASYWVEASPEQLESLCREAQGTARGRT